MKIPAISVPWGYEDVSEYGITPEDIGQYAVIQHGYACLGLGVTSEDAIDNATAAGMKAVEDIVELYANDGDITVDEVVCCIENADGELELCE